MGFGGVILLALYVIHERPDDQILLILKVIVIGLLGYLGLLAQRCDRDLFQLFFFCSASA